MSSFLKPKKNNKIIDTSKLVLNSSDELLLPIDKLNTATQIMICISGGEGLDNDKSDIFNFILTDRGMESIDYYIYKWKKNINDNKNDNSIQYGKFLAYILASREIFKFQTISILCVGDGSKVLKSCLKELSTKIKNAVDIDDLIQDIILIGTNIDFNFNQPEDLLSLKLVAGNVINIYRDKNYIIKIPNIQQIEKLDNNIITMNSSSSLNEINIKFYLPRIYNFNMIEEIQISNSYYIVQINKILKKIKEKLN